MVHIDPRAISLLTTLLLSTIGRSPTASLYDVAKRMGLSIATVYRRSLELAEQGLIARLGKGAYMVTPRGAFYLAMLGVEGRAPAPVLAAAIKKLKSDWDLAEFEDEEVEAYIRLLMAGLRRLGRTPLDFCAGEFGRTVQVLLPERFARRNVIRAIAQHLSVPVEEVMKAERIIAKAMLEFLPSVKLPDGCKTAVFLQGEQDIDVVVAASYCKIQGYRLGLDCALGRLAISKYFTKMKN
ncbi:MAG: MarR family transcriptional regulator [Thermoproteus sp. AZ2]|jgi:DNA-binding Lrp family transcriptional regulator|uniref:MarR family transcriptional regulator n=1 Tax=Thermoproteus sp. AZ2 TaxID=1609232 RepID=A0ACC6UZ71_9CREN